MTVFSKFTLRPCASVRLAVVEDLRQDVQHVRMRLLDLVEQDDGIHGLRRIFSVSWPASS